MVRFDGRVAIVAGGSSGIGAAVVRRLAGAGAVVGFFGLDPDEVRATGAALRDDGLEVDGAVVDVRDAAAVTAFVDDIASRRGGLDVVVNSAGVQRYGDVVDTDDAMWAEVIDTNLTGAYRVARAAIPHLRARGGGAIVNVASVQGRASQKGVAAYTASKGGILALTRAMALDHAADGIRVNAVCPGSVDTPMLRWAADRFRADDETADDVVAAWGRLHPLGRVATAAEVADVVAFLASDGAAFVSGADVPVDGGLLAALAVTLPE